MKHQLSNIQSKSVIGNVRVHWESIYHKSWSGSEIQWYNWTFTKNNIHADAPQNFGYQELSDVTDFVHDKFHDMGSHRMSRPRRGNSKDVKNEVTEGCQERDWVTETRTWQSDSEDVKNMTEWQQGCQERDVVTAKMSGTSQNDSKYVKIVMEWQQDVKNMTKWQQGCRNRDGMTARCQEPMEWQQECQIRDRMYKIVTLWISRT